MQDEVTQTDEAMALEWAQKVAASKPPRYTETSRNAARYILARHRANEDVKKWARIATDAVTRGLSLERELAEARHQAERETLARMEWRPIETAPQDGTRFLAWCPDVGRVIMRINGVHRETWAIDPSGRLECDPTKWMPLPPAPEAGQ